MDNSSFISELLKQTDKQKIFCFSQFDKDTIFKLICALLNNDGGWIIVGVNNSNHEVIGVNYSKEEIIDIQKKLSTQISPLPLVYLNTETYLDKTILLLTVIKGPLPPYSFKGKFYTLSGNEVVIPAHQELSSFIREVDYTTYSWEKATCVYSDIDDLDSKLIASVQNKGITNGRIKSFMEEDVDSFLSGLELNDNGIVKNGAVALFGKKNRDVLPQCHVRIQIMPLGKSGNIYHTYDYYGNLFELMDKCLFDLTTRLPKNSTFSKDSAFRLDENIYPYGVLDEAITNALIHSDYSDSTSEIKIFVYPDKIEITNAGEMKIKMSNGAFMENSILRNPLMAEVFYMDGRMEKSGRGIPFIKDQMKKKGYRQPQWKSANGYTTIYLYSTPAVLPDRTKEFLMSKRKGMTFTKKDYLKYIGDSVSEETAKKDLRSIVEAGLCILVGLGRSAYYLLT